jgi:photosystem II stability/assembly factor-like uncharacterized protein
MKKNNALFSFLLACLALWSCSKKVVVSQNENPNYYKQWFEEHKNEQGMIPEGLAQSWAEHDRLNQKLERSGFSVISKTTNLGAQDVHGGRTRAILVSSLDSNRIFAGAVSGGLWRSDDGGESWTAINDQSANLTVTCITENPMNPKEIYYGTGEVRTGIVGAGIYKSTDGGLTFNQIPSTKGIQYANYIVHSAVDSSLVWLGATSGLYTSQDNGKTFTKYTKTPIPTTSAQVSGIISFADSSVMVTFQGNNTIFKSAKGLNTPFVAIKNPAFPNGGLGRVLIEECKSMPNIIYAFFTGNEYLRQTDRGLYRSNDAGETWTRTRAVKDTIRIGSAQQIYCQMLGVSAINPDHVMVGAQYAMFSKDAGKTFTNFKYGHADLHTCIPVTAKSDAFFIGNDGGIYKGTWEDIATVGVEDKSAGYTSSQYYAGNYGPTDQTCVGGTQDNGSWRYVNGVLSKMNGADGGYAHISLQEPTLAYFSIQNGATYSRKPYTASSGTQNITPSKANAEGVNFINEFQINYADGKQLYYRTNRAIWRTLDKGKTWRRLNKTDIANISAVAVSNAENPTVFVAGSGFLYKIDSAATAVDSINYKNLLDKLPIGLKSGSYGNISFHPYDNNTIFVGMSSTSTQSRAWRAKFVEKDSIIWTDIAGNLPKSMSIYQIQAHPDAPDSVFIAASAYGMYYTINRGKTWTKETRVPNVAIYELKLRASDKSLFLFTHGRGVWHIQLADIEAIVKNNDIIKADNWTLFPNPTTAQLQVEGTETVTQLQVFDLNGKEYMSRNNTNSLDVSILPTGIYLLKIYNENGKFSVKRFSKL